LSVEVRAVDAEAVVAGTAAFRAAFTVGLAGTAAFRAAFTVGLAGTAAFRAAFTVGLAGAATFRVVVLRVDPLGAVTSPPP
jgi:hypothetical protein